MEDRKVKDIMLSLDEYATVSCEATIQEALVGLSKAQMGLTYNRPHPRRWWGSSSWPTCSRRSRI